MDDGDERLGKRDGGARWGPGVRWWAALAVLGVLLSPPDQAWAAEETLTFDGDASGGEPDHFLIPFAVPDGTVEIEIRHDNLSSENVLDWGLNDPNGFRGWGGGNSEPAVVGTNAATRSYVPVATRDPGVRTLTH